MKKLLFAVVTFPLLVMADRVYEEFLRLKQRGVEERLSFYHSMSNNLMELMRVWNEDDEVFTLARNDGVVSNIEYYVDLISTSTNLVSTNLTQVSQNFCNGEIYLYTYAKSGRMSKIEHILSQSGYFKCYEVNTNEDLECYFSMTNFVGEHGLMMYGNGQLIEVGGVPDFSNLRE